MEVVKERFSIIEKKSKESLTPKVPEFLRKESVTTVQNVHCGLPIYEETPLVRLGSLAKNLGVGDIFVKDESKRFGLNAFKGLGGIYALTCIICKELGLEIDKITFEELKTPIYMEKIKGMVFATATDGNHGKGISWAAGQLGCEAHIYMPEKSSELRAQAIRDVNSRAEVVITEMDYDDTVRYVRDLSAENGWQLVQDTSWDGYEEVPTWIMQGYTTMAYEACRGLEQLGVIPSHVFVQAGVGSMAAGVVAYIADYFKQSTLEFIVVESENNACIYESARIGDGEPHKARNQGFTIMAGLNCGEVCTIAWPILRDFAKWFIQCSDSVTESGMRILAKPTGNDEAIISGESGAVTVGMANILASSAETRELLGINEDSVILCFSTEGDTDAQNYKKIISESFF